MRGKVGDATLVGGLRGLVSFPMRSQSDSWTRVIESVDRW